MDEQKLKSKNIGFWVSQVVLEQVGKKINKNDRLEMCSEKVFYKNTEFRL